MRWETMQNIAGVIRIKDDETRHQEEAGTERGTHGFKKYRSGAIEISGMLQEGRKRYLQIKVPD